MKYLTLIRHAKAENTKPGSHDAARELTERGVQDARLMGEVLSARFPPPEIIYLSPATRVQQTVEELVRACADAARPPSMETEPGLYLADANDLWDVARTGFDRSNEVWICGHNPGIGEAIEMLSHSHIDHVPTSCVARIVFDAEDLPMGRGKLLFFDTPRATRSPGATRSIRPHGNG